MPWDQVMSKFKKGKLFSGNDKKMVKNRSQAIAIMLSEKRKAKGGKKEYASRSSNSNPRGGRQGASSHHDMPPGLGYSGGYDAGA